MDVGSLAFQTDLMIRRLSGSSIEDRGDHVVVRTPANPAYHWGNFILVLDDVRDAPRWLAAFHDAHPDANHVAIGLDTDWVDTELREAYGGLGLAVDVSEVLTARSVVGKPSPTDCRLLTSDDDWSQALEVTLVTHEITEPVEVEFATRKQAEMRRLVEAGHGGWFGARVDGQVRATLGVLTDGSRLGRYQSVETHPGFQRRGLARALLTFAADAMSALEELVIVADPEYHAINLYRSIGFESVGIQVQVGKAG